MSDQSASGGTPPIATLVTVIIRTKDRPELLERALHSVVAQDYRPLEALVVNDGHDDLADFYQRFAPDLQGLRVVPAAAPGGRISAANTGLEQARGKFLIFLDDDDWYYPDHVSKLAAALQQYPEQALAYTGVECQRTDAITGNLHTEHVFNQPFEHGFLLIRNFIPIHAAMFRRTLLDAETRFDVQLDFYEDWDFWLQLSRKTGFRYVPGISACYFLGSSGFGVEQTQRQLAAEQLFFAKWQHLWTPRELELIVEYARALPGIRQVSHDRLLELTSRLDDEMAMHSRLSQEHVALMSQRQDEMEKHVRLTLAHEDLQAANQELQVSHQQLQMSHQELQAAQLRLTLAHEDFQVANKQLQMSHQELQAAQRQVLDDLRELQNRLGDESARHEELQQVHADLQSSYAAALTGLDELQTAHRDLQADHELLKSQYDLASNQLQDLLGSNSWKVTAPLRRLVIFLRRWRQSWIRFGQRARNCIRILHEQGVSGLKQHLQSKFQNHALPEALTVIPSPAPALSTQIALRVITPQDRRAVTEKLIFPQVAAPRVSVIIPVYNHCDLTLACLQALYENPSQYSFEVIVVDDASSDETREMLAQCQGLHYLHNDSNSGFIHTCNKGADAARGDYLLFLNNDTEVQAGWLDPLVATLDADERAGIAGSKLVYPSGHLQEAGACLRADGTVDLVGLNGDPADPRYNYARPVDHCSGAAILVRAGLFRELGGFDQRYVPAYFEDCDLSLKVQEAGYKVIYQPASVVVHHLSVTTGNLPGGKLAQIARNRDIYLARWGRYLREQDKIRLIAFFLPQFHPIPENDAWWGRGFTEWTNVTRATPLFDEHYQPHRPAELGYYDLRVAEVREQQAALAREHGIYGFCYYYYWFNGKRLLERPLDDMLERGDPDFPFCVCWANENWTRRWDGREAEVLMAQSYNPESNLQFMRDLLPLLRDPRYIRINGRPLVLIYRAELIPGLSEAIAGWRQLTRDEGLGDLYLAAVESFSGVRDDLARDFDALVEFPPHARSVAVPQLPPGLSADFSGQMFDYAASSQAFMQRSDVAPELFRTAMPSWDNTPRRQQAAHIYLGATPHLYEKWLSSLVQQTRASRMGDERIVFVNAWNEWAEGNHLEPDERHGRNWLEATRNALGELGCYRDLRPADDDSAAR